MIPNLQTGVHPCGILPLLTRLPIVFIVTAVLQRAFIDGLRLLTNLLSLLLTLVMSEFCSVALSSELDGLVLTV